MPKDVKILQQSEDNQNESLGALRFISSAYSSSESESSDEDESNGIKTLQEDDIAIPPIIPMAQLDSAKCEVIKENKCKIDESNAASKEDVEPVAVLVNGIFDSSVENVAPVDFASIKIKEELKDNDSGENKISQENDTEMDDDTIEVVGVLFKGESYKEARIKEEPISDSGTSDSEVDSLDDDLAGSDSSSELSDAPEKTAGIKKRQPPRVKGELFLSDLPPIEDLKISVPHEQCRPIGAIKSVVDPLVIVEAYPNTPALNLDSVLFLEEGDRALGHIFDVFGQVKQPFYCVRFNSKDHIEKNGISPGMLVYCAPSTPHTNYVFLAQLRQMKGTDASWQDDIEPPREEMDFSDDDQERAAKKGGRRGKQRKKIPSVEDSTATEENSQSNYNSRRGVKRYQSQGQSNASYSTQGVYNQQQSPFVPPNIAGFVPHGPPPFHGYAPGYGMPFRGRRPYGRGRGGHPAYHPGYGPPPMPHFGSFPPANNPWRSPQAHPQFQWSNSFNGGLPPPPPPPSFHKEFSAPPPPPGV